MRERHIDSSAHVIKRYPGLNEFLEASKLPAGLHSVMVNELPVDFLNIPTGSDTTIVFLHGAIEPHFKIPVLTGQGISSGLTANRVFISDPALALSDNLLLSWFAGNKSHTNGQELLVQILLKVLQSNGSKRVIFFGGSGGGFAALYLASRFENSLAMAYNPQTNIAEYNSRAIHEFTQYAHGIHRREYDPLSFLPDSVKTEVCSIYSKPQPATVAYFQNLNDHTHVNRQLRPFLDQLHPENPVYLLAQAWGAGHTAPPKEQLRKALLDVSESSNWDEALKLNQFELIDTPTASRYATLGVPGTFVSPDIQARSRFKKYDRL